MGIERYKVKRYWLYIVGLTSVHILGSVTTSQRVTEPSNVGSVTISLVLPTVRSSGLVWAYLPDTCWSFPQ